MKNLILLCVTLGLAIADPNVADVKVKQDNLGNYNLQFATDGIARIEQRTVDGKISGGFSYVDPHGVLRSTAFTSGQHGFQAISPDIPVPVQDTPEVALAKAQHLALLRNAHLSRTVIPEGQYLQHKTVVASAPNVAFETVPVARVEKVVEGQVPLVSTNVVQSSQIPSVRTTLNSGDVQLLRTFEVPTEKLIKTEIPLLRTSNIAVPVSEKLIQTEVPLIRSSHVAIESAPAISEKVVKTEVPVFRTTNVESSSIPVLRSSDIAFSQAKIEVPTQRHIIQTELPLRSTQLKLESVESPRTFLEIPTSNLRVATIESPKTRLEIPSTLLKFESIESPKTLLEIPTGHLRVESIESPKTHVDVRSDSPTTRIEVPARTEFIEIPRSAIGLDSLRVVTVDGKTQILRVDGDLKSSLSKILLRE
ncbi:hypothetical protein FQR65_LT08766 [Abscondita terminalis]|nr:hypothetical protein FQR65_LT08766 [Abscondita terminalis]